MTMKTANTMADDGHRAAPPLRGTRMGGRERLLALLSSPSSSTREEGPAATTATSFTPWRTAVRERLPLIVAVGATSAGKSSVLSNLLGVDLPAASALTTRCPVLLTVRQERTMAATVQENPNCGRTVQRRRARVQVLWDPSDPGQGRRLQCPATAFDQVVQDDAWETLTSVIREAQDHILQDTLRGVARHTIAVTVTTAWCGVGGGSGNEDNNNEDDDEKKSTSGDFVSREDWGGVDDPFGTSGRIWDEWTVLDLPGWIVGRAEHEPETLVDDVQSLVTESLQAWKNAIVLVVLPANVDFHNAPVLSQALNLATMGSTGGADNCRRVALPVITKPDLIDPGAEGDVLELLRGRVVKTFPHGFHMIKGRGQAALDQNASLEQCLQNESHFFEDVEPWKSVPDRKLFGTAHLRSKLAEIESQLLRECVPDLLSDLRKQHQAAADALESLGGSTQIRNSFERRRHYQDLCRRLVSAVEASSTGKGRRHRGNNPHATTTTPSAAAQLHEAVAAFSRRILEAPLATAGTVSEGGRVLVTCPRGVVSGEVVHLDADFACVDFVEEADAQSDALFERVGVPTEETVEENEVWSDGSQVCISRRGNIYDVLRRIPLANVRTDPLWLLDKIADNRTDDLACFLNVDVFKGIVSHMIEDEWTPHCLALVDSTRRLLLEAVEGASRETFVANRYPALQSLIEQQCRQIVQDLASSALQQALASLETEKHPYTSLHDHLCRRIAQERHSRLQRELEVALRLDQKGIFETDAIRAIVDRVFERNQRVSVGEHMAQEMELVLAAYGTVATQRVLDRMPMICWEVVRAMGPSIQEALWQVPDETLQRCMLESLEYSRKHEQLRSELDELGEAIVILESMT